MRILLLNSFLSLFLFNTSFSHPIVSANSDTTKVKVLLGENRIGFKRDSLFRDVPKETVVQSPKELSSLPFVSLQQYMKGNAAGLYVQEPSGEPGTNQHMFIRGAAMPLLTKRDLYQSQPLVVLDGIPLIGNEHPFAFDIQQYDDIRVGTETNLLTSIDMNNIEKIEVMKDMAGTAIYGPRAANGVIELTSKKAGKRRAVTFNAYTGMVQRPQVVTINGEFENNFRRQFYDIYTANGRYTEDDAYPIYLSDSLNNSYYGQSNWTDSYYKSQFIHAISADISGGSDRADFRFSIGNVANKGIADGTGLDRYSAMFNMNVKPLKWLLFSAMINGNRVERVRNRNLRDRFSQMSYIPDLSAPLAPNNEVYSEYLDLFDKGFDNNATNLVQGHAKLVFDLGKLKLTSRLAVDYNESSRDLFYARPLLEQNSYASNYYGFNQRLIVDNILTYDWQVNKKNVLRFEGGNVIQWDLNKYNYGYGYKGLNDFIKLNLLDKDLNPTAFPRQLVYKFLDRTRQNLVSFYGKGNYNFDKKYTLSFLLRLDGSSNAQPTQRWLMTQALSLGWNIKNDLLVDNSFWSDLNLRINAGRLGRLNSYDNYAQGPQYTSEFSYTKNKINPGYNGFAGLSRPYDFGWVGYDMPWAYTDQLNVGLDAAWNNNHLSLSIDGYVKQDRNQIIAIPTYGEYGYSQSHHAGMDVQNMGVDVLFSADVVHQSPKFSWTTTLALNYNKNKLMALPNGLNELVVGDRLLKVGESIDKFWLYTNNGIYLADEDVPQVNGTPLTYNGIALRAGDPRWEDKNGDNQIGNADKALMGNMFPKVSGSFNNDFKYANWSLGVNLYFNLGRNVMNQEMANRFDFINHEGMNDMGSVKEITFWEKRGDYSKYPLYNPWSPVIPYRVEQDLFLEKASFLKLRSMTIGYELSSWIKEKFSKNERVYIYGSATNLFTISSYSGRDPELVDYTGYDNGYGMRIPTTYTIGVKLDL